VPTATMFPFAIDLQVRLFGKGSIFNRYENRQATKTHGFMPLANLRRQ
jgi:hypothetical protein